MKFKIVKLNRFSGTKASIYSIIMNDDEQTLFEHFLEKHKESHLLEIQQMIATIDAMGKRFGVKENFFRRTKEGKLGDGVEALYDSPNAKLRLYCIRYGSATLILGDGGQKNVRAWQDDPKLTKAATEMINLSATITEAIKDRELSWNGNNFIGKLTFDDND